MAERLISAATQLARFQHFVLQQDAAGVLWLGLNVRDHTINRLNHEVLDELEPILTHIQTIKPIGLIWHSTKHNSFLQGVDVNLLQSFETREQVLHFSQRGQRLLQTLRELDFPTLALIEGSCSGVGIELALSLRHRIAVQSNRTQFILAELKAGLYSIFGNSSQLTNQLGLAKTLSLLLNHQPLTVEQALDCNLIEAICHPEHAFAAAQHYILNNPKPTSSWFEHWTDNSLVRSIQIRHWQQQLLIQGISPHHYPAPHTLLTLWSKHRQNKQALQHAETEAVADLLFMPQSRNLLRLHALKEYLKKPLLSTPITQNTPIKTVHIIGAGTMGRDIAIWCAQQGLHVSLQDRKASVLEQTIAYTQGYLKPEHQLKADLKGKMIPTADIIIEAIPDHLSDKQEIFALLEEQAKPTALLATTTSVIALDKIAAVLLQPERLIGVHFLNPALKLDLVEVIYHKSITDEKIIEQTCAFVCQINKLPLPLENKPGYLINRILFSYILQGIRLHQQGVPHTILDKVSVDFGMPMGPLQLADLFGLDYCRRVGELITKTSQIKLPELLVTMTNAGKLGCKSGSGFYRYRNGKALKTERVRWDGSITALQDKLVNQMVEEASLCLEQGVVDDPDLLDVAVVCGTGFAPFLGGPLHYAKSLRKESLPKGD